MNIEFDKQIVKNLFTNTGLTRFDLADIRDYFLYNVLDIMRENEREKASKYADFLETAEALLYVSEARMRVIDQETREFYKAYFYTLAQLLSLRFSIERLPGELPKREDFDKRMENIRERLI